MISLQRNASQNPTRYYFISIGMVKFKKKAVVTSNAGKHVEPLEPSYFAYALLPLWKTFWHFLTKLKISLFYDP